MTFFRITCESSSLRRYKTASPYAPEMDKAENKEEEEEDEEEENEEEKEEDEEEEETKIMNTANE